MSGTEVLGTQMVGPNGIWTPGTTLKPQGITLAQKGGQDEAVMVGCMDRKLTFRRRHPLRKKFKVLFPDLLCHGGGAYRLCDPRMFANHVTDRRLRLWQSQCDVCEHDINEVAVNAHGITRIILTTHQRCGMMALDGHAFPKELLEPEKVLHRKVLDAAANWVVDNCPGIKEIITSFEYFEQQGEKELVQWDELAIAA